MSRLPGLAPRWRAGEFSAAIFASLYFLHWQMALHGRQFAARKNKSDSRPDLTEWLKAIESVKGVNLHEQLLDWLERYQFRGVIGNVPVALVRWLQGAWPLILCQDIPSPRDILRWQAQGERAVTVLTEVPRLCKPVLNKSDAFDFFLHDLEHAYKYFHSPALRAGQREFFSMLENAFDRGVFAAYFEDAEFVNRFHYLMSDMNTHPEHSRQYLRAILVEFHLRDENKGGRDPLSSAAELAIEKVIRTVSSPGKLTACA